MSEILIAGDRHYIPDPERPDLRFRFAIEDTSEKLVVQVSGNGGKTWKPIMSETPNNIGIGWVPSFSENGSVQWVPVSQAIGSSDPTFASSLQTWTDFSFPAELQNGVTFGLFEVPENLSFQVYGAQINIFSPSEVGDLKISFINAKTQDGDALIDDLYLDDGISYKSFSFAPFTLSSGSQTSAKVSFTPDAGFPGSFLVARLLLRGI